MQVFPRGILCKGGEQGQSGIKIQLAPSNDTYTVQWQVGTIWLQGKKRGVQSAPSVRNRVMGKHGQGMKTSLQVSKIRLYKTLTHQVTD